MWLQTILIILCVNLYRCQWLLMCYCQILLLFVPSVYVHCWLLSSGVLSALVRVLRAAIFTPVPLHGRCSVTCCSVHHLWRSTMWFDLSLGTTLILCRVYMPAVPVSTLSCWFLSVSSNIRLLKRWQNTPSTKGKNKHAWWDDKIQRNNWKYTSENVVNRVSVNRHPCRADVLNSY